MARILFTVCGVGFGHASRSQIILGHLKKKHELKITSYSEGYEFLKNDYPKIQKLDWFRYYFDNNRIARAKTILFNLSRVPFVLWKNFSALSKIIKEFRPDMIVSDFDSNGLYAGKIFGVPVILVSNMHLAEYFKAPLGFWEKIVFELTDHLMLRAYFCADFFLVASIMKPADKTRKNRFFFHPLVRETLAKKNAIKKNFFLCYASLKNLASVLPAITQLANERFVVYGLGKRAAEKNVEFREFSKQGWADDIQGCRGLLCHGGLLSISEAVVLKKPVYVTATNDWFERYHNGQMVQALGFGLAQKEPTIEGIKEFIKKNAFYSKNLVRADIKPSNNEFLEKLDELIEGLVEKKAHMLRQKKAQPENHATKT